MANRSKGNRPNQGDEQLEREVFEALRQEGWILPETEQEVRLAEEDLERAPVVLPPELSDPSDVLKRVGQPVRFKSLAPGAGDQRIESDLARAARESGTIPPDVEERMRRDRQEAERKRDGK